MQNLFDTLFHKKQLTDIKPVIWNLLSLTATPLIIFISTSNAIFLGNQNDFNHDLMLLLPFFGLFVVLFCIGITINLFSKFVICRYALWFYYSAGPFFLLYSFLIVRYSNSITFVLLYLIIFVAITVFFTLKFSLKKIRFGFTIFGLLLIIGEAALFGSAYKPLKKNNLKLPAKIIDSRGMKLPNIYHIIFDEYQTDLFSVNLTSEVKKEMGGFIFFPNNTTIYGGTLMSVASTFLGKTYDYNGSQIAYKMEAFNSKKSLLAGLKNSGYKTFGFIEPVYSFEQRLFDYKINHGENVKIRINNYKSFFTLWSYRYLPEYVNVLFINRAKLKEIQNRTFLPPSIAIISYHSFIKYIRKEKYLPANNRYTFIHLILPHGPYVFNSDCSYNRKIKTTNAYKQCACTTNVLLEFIKTLKKLKRYDDSMLIVHSDHGGFYTKKNGRFIRAEKGHNTNEVSWNRSRALLLIKPMDRKSKHKFTVSSAETNLLDIAPTIYRSIRLKPSGEHEGVSLVDPLPHLSKRKRYYHFYDGKNQIQWTTSMTRFIIFNNKIKFDKKINLTNNYQGSKINDNLTYTFNHSEKKNNNTIIVSDGTIIPVIPNQLKGALGKSEIKGKYVVLGGVAIDEKNGILPEKILIFEDKKFIFAGKTTLPRQDVANYKRNNKLTYSGFLFVLPVHLFHNLSNAKIRLFAVSKDGVASEFDYFADHKWK